MIIKKQGYKGFLQNPHSLLFLSYYSFNSLLPVRTLFLVNVRMTTKVLDEMWAFQDLPVINHFSCLLQLCTLTMSHSDVCTLLRDPVLIALGCSRNSVLNCPVEMKAAVSELFFQSSLHTYLLILYIYFLLDLGWEQSML